MKRRFSGSSTRQRAVSAVRRLLGLQNHCHVTTSQLRMTGRQEWLKQAICDQNQGASFGDRGACLVNDVANIRIVGVTATLRLGVSDTMGAVPRLRVTVLAL